MPPCIWVYYSQLSGRVPACIWAKASSCKRHYCLSVWSMLSEKLWRNLQGVFHFIFIAYSKVIDIYDCVLLGLLSMQTTLNQCQCDCWRDKRGLCGRCVYTFPVKTMNWYIFHSFGYFVDRLYIVLKRLCAWLFHNSNDFVCNVKIWPGSKYTVFIMLCISKRGTLL